jgi:hypothetical protein
LADPVGELPCEDGGAMAVLLPGGTAAVSSLLDLLVQIQFCEQHIFYWHIGLKLFKGRKGHEVLGF